MTAPRCCWKPPPHPAITTVVGDCGGPWAIESCGVHLGMVQAVTGARQPRQRQRSGQLELDLEGAP